MRRRDKERWKLVMVMFMVIVIVIVLTALGVDDDLAVGAVDANLKESERRREKACERRREKACENIRDGAVDAYLWVAARLECRLEGRGMVAELLDVHLKVGLEGRGGEGVGVPLVPVEKA